MTIALQVVMLLSIINQATICSDSPRSTANTDVYISEDEAQQHDTTHSSEIVLTTKKTDPLDVHDWVLVPRITSCDKSCQTPDRRSMHSNQQSCKKVSHTDVVATLAQQSTPPFTTENDTTLDTKPTNMPCSFWEICDSEHDGPKKETPLSVTAATTKTQSPVTSSLCPYVLHTHKLQSPYKK